jgi:hypothetical protein
MYVYIRPDRPRPTALLPPRSNGKPEAATAVYKLLMMGKRMPETCWAVFERRAINLRDWCIWLVHSFECMMMHGVTHPKFIFSLFHAEQPVSTQLIDYACFLLPYIFSCNTYNMNTGPHTVHVLANLQSGRRRFVKSRCPNWSVTSSHLPESDTVTREMPLHSHCSWPGCV